MFDVQFIHWSNSGKAASSKAINFMFMLSVLKASRLITLFPSSKSLRRFA